MTEKKLRVKLTSIHHKAYCAGYFAAVQRQLLVTNPHTEGTQKHDRWEKGWERGAETVIFHLSSLKSRLAQGGDDDP